MKNELIEIPFRANMCFEMNKGIILPEKVPYIGMGSSYFAALVVKFLGVKIYPELASEYYHYQRQIKQFDNAVLISQSGRTSEVVKCAECFSRYVAIVNDAKSPLAAKKNVYKVVEMAAGNEHFSSSKTYINTLLALYLGHGFNAKPALDSITERFQYFEDLGEELGKELLKRLRKRKNVGFYILGSGPNMGTAHQAALILSESTKLPFIGMSLSQYDHGPKETAENSFVFAINPEKGLFESRTKKLLKLIERNGAVVFEVGENVLDETFSPLATILPFCFMADYVAEKLEVENTYQVGAKITMFEN